jgi:diguanylate cyclase (GGDEF)-like protein
MSKIPALLKWFAVDDAQPDIALAQYVELQRQVPLLYALLIVNACAVAYTHYGLAPNSLILPILVLVLICGVRLVTWLRRRHLAVTAPEAIAALRQTVVLSGIIAVAYITWSLCLEGYGGPYERGHVALFIAITVVGCIFCLMNLPQAALLVTVIVTVPYLVYYLSMGNTVFFAIAVNIFLVTAVMLQVLFNSYRGFTTLVRTQAETRRLSDENAMLAHTDALTTLPNRRYFLARLASQIETSAAAGAGFAVGVLDLDRFKPINDTHGHIFGDRLLAEVGARLTTARADDLIVARLGGDEFGFILLADAEKAKATGQALCDLISQPYDFEDNRVSIGCSCGLAMFPDAGRTVHELFDRSDYALYHSKSSRRGMTTLYSSEHENRIRSERAIEAALHSADFDSEMQVHLQPMVDTDLGRVVAVEALARWTSPTLGRVAPDIFIAIAERAGLIHKLTLVLLQKSLEELDRLPPGINLSFNLSAHDITDHQTVLALVAMIRKANAASRLVLELTETAVMRNFEIAENSIRLLRSLGVRIAIDDFGTGFSSLGYLHRLTIDKVKIDRSFVSELDHPSGHNIVASIVGLCRNLELECIVEGVETAGQLAILHKIGCRIFQGYLFARPMPTSELLACLADIPAIDSGTRQREQLPHHLIA